MGIQLAVLRHMYQELSLHHNRKMIKANWIMGLTDDYKAFCTICGCGPQYNL